MISSAQVKAARALVGLTQKQLAEAARVSEISVKNVEGGATDPRVSTLSALRSALERAGVVFLPENGGGAGVRLFKENLIGWAQCETPYPGDFRGIQEPFEALFTAARGPSDMALFSRTSDGRESEIFLLSPAAAKIRSALAGRWGPAVTPSLFGWTLLVGNADAYRRFGIHSPRMAIT